MENKKLAAAVAAVYTCIRTSEEAAAQQAAQSPEGAAGGGIGLHPPAQPANVWGMSGRQAQMQGGSMMQLRMFK